jgi:hypothetical protein
MPRKKARPVTLAEHVARIGKLGGIARAQKLSAQELSDIGQKAGVIGGKARSAKLSAKRRQEIARKAAAARWGDRKKAAGGAISGVPTQAGRPPSKGP